MALNAVAEQPITQAEVSPAASNNKKEQGSAESAKPTFNKARLANLLKDNPAAAIGILASPEKFKQFAADHQPANDESGRTSPILATASGERTDGFKAQGETSQPEDQKSDLEKALDNARHDLVDARLGIKGLLKSTIGSEDLAEKNKAYNDLLQKFNTAQLEELGDQIKDPKILEKAMRDSTIGEWNKLKQEEVDIKEQKLAESHMPALLKKSYRFLIDKYSQTMAAGTNALVGEDAKWYKKMAASMAIGIGVNAATLGVGGVAMRVGGAAVLTERLNAGLNIRSEHKVSQSQEEAIQQGLQEVAGAEPDKVKDRAMQWIADQSAATTDRYSSNKWVKAKNFGISLAAAAGFSLVTRTGAQYAGEGLQHLASTETGQAVIGAAQNVANSEIGQMARMNILDVGKMAAKGANELVGINTAHAYTEGPLDPTGIPPFHGNPDAGLPHPPQVHADTTGDSHPITPEPAAHPVDTSSLNKPFESGAKFPQAPELKIDHPAAPATPATSQEGVLDKIGKNASKIWKELEDIGSDGTNHHTPDQSSAHPGTPSESAAHNISVHHLGKDEHSLWKFFTDYAKGKDPNLTNHQLNNIAANAINRFTPDQLSHYFPHGVSHIQPGQEIPVDEHSFGNLIDHAKTGAPLEHHADSAHALDHEPSQKSHGNEVRHHASHGHRTEAQNFSDRAYDAQQNIRGKSLDTSNGIFTSVFSENPNLSEQDKINFMQKMMYHTHAADVTHNVDPGTPEDAWAREFQGKVTENYTKFGKAGLPHGKETPDQYFLRIGTLEHDTGDRADETLRQMAEGAKSKSYPVDQPTEAPTAQDASHETPAAKPENLASEADYFHSLPEQEQVRISQHLDSYVNQVFGQHRDQWLNTVKNLSADSVIKGENIPSGTPPEIVNNFKQFEEDAVAKLGPWAKPSGQSVAKYMAQVNIALDRAAH